MEDATDAFDPGDLVRVARMRMPFGRYQGTVLVDLPEPYLVWFEQHGYPRGSLGDLMRLALEIRSNGLLHLVAPLRWSPGEARGPDAPPDERSGAGDPVPS